MGCMSHAARTGLWITPLYYRALLLHRLGWIPRCQMSLSQPSLEDLRWLVSSTPHDRNSLDITPSPFDLTIRTDASLLGWGATCDGTSTRTLERGGGRTTHQLFGTQGTHSSFKGIPESRYAATTTESGPPSPTSYPLEMDN